MTDPTVPADSIGADYSVTVGAALKNILRVMIKLRRPVMIWGGPGVGKSQVAEQLAGEMQWADAQHQLHPHTYWDVRALLYENVDMRGGIPWRDPETNITHWGIPSFLPHPDADGGHLVCLDELPSAPPSMQTALYQLVQNRRCGDYVLPDGAAVIACGNRESDRGHVYRMLAPLASRFVHIDVKPDANEWLRWAAQKGLAAEVIFFIRYRRNLLYQFDPRSKEMAFACPRTWEYAAEIVEHGRALSAEEMRIALRGTVGEACAVELTSFLNVWKDLDDPMTIIRHPETARIPSKMGPLLATCGSLYRLADDQTIDSIIRYAQRIRAGRSPEIAEFLVGQCVRHDPLVQNSKSFIRWTTLND